MGIFFNVRAILAYWVFRDLNGLNGFKVFREFSLSAPK